MRRPAAAILSFLILSLLESGCSAAREIPAAEIPRFNSVVDLYEAKYRRVGGNVWWKPYEDPSYRIAQFNIATNPAKANSRKTEFYNVSKIFCESKGGFFSQTDNLFEQTIYSNTLKAYNESLDKIVARRKNTPDFTCKKDDRVLFQGVMIAGFYRLQYSGMRGIDLRVCLYENK